MNQLRAFKFQNQLTLNFEIKKDRYTAFKLLFKKS